MEAALKACNDQKNPCYTSTANLYGVERSRLSKTYRGKQQSREDYNRFFNGKLSKAQEDHLCDYIDELTKRSIAPTHAMLRTWAYEISAIPVGRNWPYRFVQRHGDRVKSMYLKGIESACTKADSEFEYSRWFELVELP